MFFCALTQITGYSLTLLALDWAVSELPHAWPSLAKKIKKQFSWFPLKKVNIDPFRKRRGNLNLKTQRTTETIFVIKPSSVFLLTNMLIQSSLHSFCHYRHYPLRLPGIIMWFISLFSQSSIVHLIPNITENLLNSIRYDLCGYSSDQEPDSSTYPVQDLGWHFSSPTFLGIDFSCCSFCDSCSKLN